MIDELDGPISRRREKAKRTESAPDIHRTLPQSVDGEKGLLSSGLLAPREVLGMMERKGVTAEWFHIPAHQVICTELQTMFREGLPVDFISLSDRLRKQKTGDRTSLLDVAGGVGSVTELFTYLPTAANAEYYLDIIAEKYFLRETIRTCTAIASKAYDEDGLDDIRQEAESYLAKLAEPEGSKPTQSIHDLTLGIIDKVSAGRSEETWGLSTGYSSLDAVVRGLRAGNMVAIGGETSAGKTSLALNVIHNTCVKRGIPTLIFTLEMSAEEVTEVLLQIGSGVNLDAAAEGRISIAEGKLLAKAAEALQGAPLTIKDEKDLSIVQARGIARRLRPRLIVGDYAQLFTGGKRKYEREDQEIGDISRNFKKMCGELSATGLLLTQLNEDGKTAGSRKIAKDCDQLWIVKVTDEDERTVQICKQRRGRKDEVPFRWIGAAQKFLAKPI